jgi:hypothetical protein
MSGQLNTDLRIVGKSAGNNKLPWEFKKGVEKSVRSRQLNTFLFIRRKDPYLKYRLEFTFTLKLITWMKSEIWNYRNNGIYFSRNKINCILKTLVLMKTKNLHIKYS